MLVLLVGDAGGARVLPRVRDPRLRRPQLLGVEHLRPAGRAGRARARERVHLTSRPPLRQPRR
eukprot:121323-Prorocentrum_minimum.AAC.1